MFEDYVKIVSCPGRGAKGALAPSCHPNVDPGHYDVMVGMFLEQAKEYRELVIAGISQVLRKV